MLRKRILLPIIITVVAITAAILISQSYTAQRSGIISAPQLSEPTTVTFDQYGVPHIKAKTLDDMYFTLGYIHAQDRLFQMETMRRLAQGRLAEIFGSKLIKTDTLFRTLGISRHADQYVANANKNTPAWKAFENYLSGVNHFQTTGKLPIEFDLLGIEPTDFTLEDSVSVAGYMAYSFAVAMRTEPVMTYIATQLESEHLELFDLDQANNSDLVINQDTLASLTQLGELSELHQSLGQLEGSNAWAIHGSRTVSGKPILESDPHISFSVPGTWYEAHVQAGDFEMYGHHLPLVAPAMLGHNRQFGWGITMFQNDDIDFYLEKTNPDNAKQVWSTDHWQDIQSYPEVIRVKDEADINIEVRTTRNGPIINDVFDGYSNSQPVSLWWTFTQSDNPMLEAFYGMNHANNIDEFALAVQGIHAPGLNIMYANADNNIGWWAAARIPKRPDHVLPWQILDGASGLDSPQGFYDFKYNPQEVNPDRGYIVSANARQHKYLDFMTPGYYNFPARAEKITEKISALDQATLANQQPIQLDIGSDYAKRALTTMLTTLAESEKSNNPELVQQLQQWDGNFTLSSIAATVFIEWQYQLAEQAFNDELGDDLFGLMKRTRKIDYGFYNILKAPNSPWWNSINNDQVNSMSDVVNNSWETTLTTLSNNLGENWRDWQWQKVHTFELAHALGASKLLRPLFNIGPVPVVGAHAVPNNLSQKFTSGHHSVTAGPSTRRLIDFAQPEKSLGILPAGQSGNPFDRHYKDQFELYTQGQYRPQIMDMDTSSTKSTLTFQP